MTPPGSSIASAAASSSRCNRTRRATSSGVLCQAMSGWRRIVPVAVQGASSSRRATGAGGRHSRASATTTSAARSSRARFCAEPLGPLRGGLDRDHLGAGGGELGGLAARRRAEVEDRSAGDVRQQAGGQRGCGVLHPPGALAIARQLLDRAARRAAQRAAVQQPGVEAARPDLGVLLDREVERRLDEMRLGDPPREIVAIGARTTPATASPAC